MTKIPRADIMIVDDTPANLYLLESLLDEKGYRVRPLTNAAMALQSARKNPPDIILLDVNMPEMDGYEMCKALKEEPVLREAPVIFISALSDIFDKVKAFELGGVDYITKPFNIEEVIARITTHLGIRRYQNEIKEKNRSLEETMAELKETKSQLIRSERMAALNELILNISHQWRQHLAVAGFLTDELRMQFDTGELSESSCHDLTDKLTQEIQSMSERITRFYNFFRPDETKQPFFPNDAVGKAVELLEAKLTHEKIDLNIEDNAKIEATGYPNAYAQAILNILENAVEALTNNTQSQRKIRIAIDKDAAKRSIVTIENNGGTIGNEVIKRMFDPYFTTKFQDDNVGISLYMAKMVIEKSMNGELSVENINGGAKFTISLAETGQQ